MKCENCGIEHDGSYGSGRFCSKKCRMQWIGKKAHKTAVENGRSKSGFSKRKYPHGTWICPICGEVLPTRMKLRTHKIEVHHIVSGPRNKGGVSWNKGKTAKDDPRIAKIAETKKAKYASGELKGTWLGKHHTEEQKKQISETMKAFYRGRSRWYTQIEKRRSYAEQFFEQVFTDAERNFHVDRYFLDFAWPEKKIYIEVDGEQHYNDEKVIKHDIERTEVLGKLGWILLKRIRWSEFQSMSSDDKSNYINNLLGDIFEYV